MADKRELLMEPFHIHQKKLVLFSLLDTYRPFRKQAVAFSLVFVLCALFLKTSRLVHVITQVIESYSLKGGHTFFNNYHITHDGLTRGGDKSKDREMTVIIRASLLQASSPGYH
jgi:hypothetical protein